MTNDIFHGIPFDASQVYNEEGELSYDYTYYAQDLANWMKTYFKNGILVSGGQMLGTQLQVVPLDTGAVQVLTGDIVIEGRTGFLKESQVITISPSEFNRYDRVVVELNLNESVNQLRLVVLHGTASSDIPLPPELTRSEESKIFQLSLAKILVQSGGIVSVTDERPEEELCGISQVLIGVRPPLPVTGDSADNISYDPEVSQLEGVTVQAALDELAAIAHSISTDKEVTLLAEGWTNNEQVVSLSGITSSMKAPIVDVIATNQEQDKEWGKIWRVSTETNALRFYCTEPTTINLNVRVKVVR